MARIPKDIDNIFFENTPKIEELARICEDNNAIEKELYTQYEVKRGLRDVNGKGVLAGLTNISDVCATKIVDGKEVPCAGNLYYRGYNIKDLVRGFLEAKHSGFEETAYLLLFGSLPTEAQLDRFSGNDRGEKNASSEFCKGRYYEGAKQGHDEHDFPVHTELVYVR